MITTGPVEAFFKPPAGQPSDDGDCLLFHLRRDLESLYGRESDKSQVSPSHALLATMGIMNGIDYLSKVYSIETKPHNRFVKTIQELLALEDDVSEALYQLRCALVHEIGLSAVSNSYRKGTKFTFELTDVAGQPLILKISDLTNEVSYVIGFWELKQCFKRIIEELFHICNSSTHPNNAWVINRIAQMHSEKLLKL